MPKKYVVYYVPSYIAPNTVVEYDNDDYETMLNQVFDVIRKYRRGLYSECPRVFEKIDTDLYQEIDIYKEFLGMK